MTIPDQSYVIQYLYTCRTTAGRIRMRDTILIGQRILTFLRFQPWLCSEGAKRGAFGWLRCMHDAASMMWPAIFFNDRYLYGYDPSDYPVAVFFTALWIEERLIPYRTVTFMVRSEHFAHCVVAVFFTASYVDSAAFDGIS